MSSPRFSIVVPTRNRADTLRHTLRTCLDQQGDDYEILVSDNGTEPGARAVVDELGSDRIRYIRPEHELAMCDHWEFALGQARGEYTTYLGDDDGLMPWCIEAAGRFLDSTAHRAVRWERAAYYWPDVASPEYPNLLRVPVDLVSELRQARRFVRLSASGEVPGQSLPMIYNSFIHRSLIEEAVARTGRLFQSVIPDIYSGYVFALLLGEYPSLGVPLAIEGVSGRSNGSAVTAPGPKNETLQDFERLQAASSVQWHPQVPNIRSHVVTQLEPFLQAKERFPGSATRFRLDFKKVILSALDHGSFYTEDQWNRALDTVEATVSGDPELSGWMQRTRNSLVRPQEPARLRPTFGLWTQYLVLDGAGFEVRNVHEAARLCARVAPVEPARMSRLHLRKRRPLPRLRSAWRVLNGKRVVWTLREGR